MSNIYVKPSLSLGFDPAYWNRPSIKSYTNCFAYAFDNARLGCTWFNKIPGFSDSHISDGEQKTSFLIESLGSHRSFIRIKKHDGLIKGRHIVAVATESSHIYRFNNVTGLWAEKFPGEEIRQWDDIGDPLLCLENAYRKYSRPAVAYFEFLQTGFEMEASIPTKPIGDYAPQYEIEAKENYYRRYPETSETEISRDLLDVS